MDSSDPKRVPSVIHGWVGVPSTKKDTNPAELQIIHFPPKEDGGENYGITRAIIKLGVGVRYGGLLFLFSGILFAVYKAGGHY